ncbi:hypothetical protein [Arthrobacter terrae]|uniref:hypothetical protein n=1 Tax=Arthrobacter terrae TaxID=2935737 RepID=UPI001E2B0B0B|nr:hypothetical protein [Arthrobacter terrae]
MTRFAVTIVEAKMVRDLWTEGWSGSGPQSPCRDAYQAVDAEGTQWSRDWDGCHNDGPGYWKAADSDRRAESNSAKPDVYYSQKLPTGYGVTFTELTASKEA